MIGILSVRRTKEEVRERRWEGRRRQSEGVQK